MLAENLFGGACTETLNTFRQTISRQNEKRSRSSIESVDQVVVPVTASLPLGEFVEPLGRRHLETGAERLVEVRQIVEAAIVGDLGNVVVAALGFQHLRAGIEPGFEQPAAESRSQSFKAAVNRSERHGKMRRHKLRRQVRAVQVLPA